MKKLKKGNQVSRRNTIFFYLSVVCIFTCVSCDHLDRSASNQKISPTSTPQTGPNPSNQPSELDAYTITGGSNLQSGTSGLSGSGRLIFNEPLKYNDNNFSLHFRLQENASLSLLANTDNGLTNGVSLSFSRANNKILKVQMTRAAESYDLSPDFAAITSDANIKIEIDVHSHGHVIIWVNGAQIGEYAFAIPLTYKFWGLAIDKCEIYKAKATKAKVEG